MTRIHSPTVDVAMQRVSELCLALPEVVRSERGDHADFRVRKKVFAYLLNNHHGDGILSVCVKTILGENVDRAGSFPEVYYLPAYIGKQGWFGMRLDRDPVDFDEVARIVKSSYRLVAPQALLRALER